MSSPWLLAAVTVGVVVLLMVATALWARAVGRVSVVDTVWGLGFVLVGAVAAVVGDGEPWRRVLLAVLTGVWGGRLASHIWSRSSGEGHGEDPRYAKLLEGRPFSATITKVFVPQGLAMAIVSLPLAVGGASAVAWWPVVVVGVVVWAVGLTFEAVGDRQLAAYKRRPRDQRPAVMDQGLWAWTRHPNYFGDATVWWGLWLVGGLASGLVPGPLTVVAPLAMTYFLRNVTGAALLEQTMSTRPGWDEYAARVPLFFPRPPRRVG